MSRHYVELQLFDQSRETRGLTFGQVEHLARERSGVDDGVLERTLQAAADKPGVKRVVAVLDEHRTAREVEERSPRVLELGGANQHRAIDLVPLLRVRIDGRAAVDERVEERKGSCQVEAFGADLQDQERRVSSCLDVERDELRLGKRRVRAHARRVDGDLLPRHRRKRAAGLEIDGLAVAAGHLASARARRAHAISGPVKARSSSTATM